MKVAKNIIIPLVTLLTISSNGQSDTTIMQIPENAKVELVNKSFDEYVSSQAQKENDQNSIWDTLIPLLIGSGITLLTQLLMDIRKNRKESRSEVLLTKAELEKLKHLLRDNYRELAMHKAHKNYWYAHYKFERKKKDIDNAEVDKFYNYHINSSSRVRDTENKIANNFSEYCKQVNKLQYLTKFNDKVKELILEYIEYKPDKPKDIVAENQSELYLLEREEEDRLLEVYQHFITIIEKINNELK